MKDMVIIIAIVIFWGILGLSLTYIFQDSSIQQLNLEAQDSSNRTYILANTSQSYLNITSDELQTDTSSKGFLDMVVRMFSFRIPSSVGLPEVVISFIEILNFILLLILGLVVYRLVRSGAG
jgi:hypothetical protein